jgi:pantoate--beta-alanine ligase
MLVIKTIKDIDNHLFRLKKQRLNIGYAPTMGALHNGHLSLIKAGLKVCDVVVCSIFVNPTQFNDRADFEHYPETIERDIGLLSDAGCDILFLPSVKEMYPAGFGNPNKRDFGFLAETLEGEFRPGHFNGMAQIVEKLLRIIKPDALFMGQKDYQQQLIVGELIKQMKISTKLILCATERERSGLAMSSRNVRLKVVDRKLAVEISRTLNLVKVAVHRPASKIASVEQWGLKRLSGFKGIAVEYFEIRNAETLKPALDKSEKLVALAAVKIGGVRLIDNVVLS